MLKPTWIEYSAIPNFTDWDIENVEFCASAAVISASDGSHVAHYSWNSTAAVFLVASS